MLPGSLRFFCLFYGRYQTLPRSLWCGKKLTVAKAGGLEHWPLQTLSDKVREKSGKRSFLKLRFVGEAWKQAKTLF
jgi:hypothetical protein